MTGFEAEDVAEIYKERDRREAVAQQKLAAAQEDSKRLAQEAEDFLHHAIDQGWIADEDESDGTKALRDAIDQARKETKS